MKTGARGRWLSQTQFSPPSPFYLVLLLQKEKDNEWKGRRGLGFLCNDHQVLAL
jgi:hypothetical protein